MTKFEMVRFKVGDSGTGVILFRDPYAGRLRGIDVLIGDAVDEDGGPLYGEHSSQRFLPTSEVTDRRVLRLDPADGLVWA